MQIIYLILLYISIIFVYLFRRIYSPNQSLSAGITNRHCLLDLLNMNVFRHLEVLTMKKIISILLAYCMLILPTGCSTSSKLLSMKEATTIKNKKYLVLHTPTKTYNLYNYNFTEKTLEGSLAVLSNNNKSRIHVYTNQIFDSKPSLDYNQFVTIYEINIQSINYFKPKGKKTAIITVASVVSFYLLASLLSSGSITNLQLGNAGE